MTNPPPAPSAVQLTTSADGLTNLNNSSTAKAPQFEISGLTTPPAGDTAQVIIYADGTQIGQATVSGSSAGRHGQRQDQADRWRSQDHGRRETHVPRLARHAGRDAHQRGLSAESIKVATVVPQITSTPVTQAVAGLTMNYQVRTNAATTEQLTYMLVTAPAGMAISSSGKISWVPAIGTTSPQRADVRIIDQFGNFFDQVFSIRVSGPNPFIPASVVNRLFASSGMNWL